MNWWPVASFVAFVFTVLLAISISDWLVRGVQGLHKHLDEKADREVERERARTYAQAELQDAAIAWYDDVKGSKERLRAAVERILNQ